MVVAAADGTVAARHCKRRDRQRSVEMPANPWARYPSLPCSNCILSNLGKPSRRPCTRRHRDTVAGLKEQNMEARERAMASREAGAEAAKEVKLGLAALMVAA